MPPRREDDSTAASRQLNEANNTLNRFLGGSSSRRMSWLNGGTAPINTNPRPPALERSPPSRTRDTGAHEAEIRPTNNDSRTIESTSNSPQLPNNALAVSVQAAPSISPPQTPNMHQSPEPFAITYIEPVTAAASDMTTDETRKRKQIDAFGHDGPLNRMSILSAGATGTPPVPHMLGRSTSPREPIAPPISPQMNSPMGVISPTYHSRQHSDLSSTWQQAHQAYAAELPLPRPQQQQRPPSHVQVPRARAVPSSVNTTISSPTLYHSANPIRRTSSIHSPLVGSPTTPNPAAQYPSPQSASVSTIPPQPQRGYPPSHQSPQVSAMPNPQQAVRPSLPVIQPYSKENCVPAIRKFHLQLTLDKLPPLAGVEYSRTDMLFRAAEDNDSLFLFVHQVVTMAHIDLDVVPSILRKAQGFSSAVSQMQHMLAGDEIKNYKLLDFYTKLPCQLNFLAMEAPESYQTLTKHMKHLSYSLSTDWPALKQVCLQRGYPPLATEMWVLNMFSPSLMDVFFTASMRQIWDFTKPNFIQGTREHAKNLYEENKRALYGSLDGWTVQTAVIAEIGAISHHQFAMMLQQLAARRTQSPRQAQGGVQHQGTVLRSNAPGSHGTPSSPRVISPHTMQPPPVHTSRQQTAHMRSSSGSRHSNAPVRPVQQTGGPLLPPAGAPRPNQAATATWTLSALHQAQLRDPRFDFAANIKQEDLLYQSVHAFAISPRRLNGTDLYQTFSLTILPDARIAQTMDPQDGQRKLRRLSEDSLQFRLRIVKVGLPPPNPNIQENLEQDWVLKPTSWPTNFYYLLNDHELEVRRKQHHTKDLPIDITEYMCQGGEMNTLAIYANVGADEAATLLPQYAFAIEVIGANSHKSILEQCEKRIISSEASLNAITASLKRPLQVDGADDDDDDLIIDDARTNITIYDPICQGKICALPARGEGCKHRECFDLLTFLQTRPREQPTWPSEADAWKCPICLGDVRPQRLVIDGFLKEVGEKLTSEGKEKTRVIIVEADGSWTPKIEEGLDSGRSTPEVDEVMVDNTNTSGAVANGTPVLPNAPQLAKKRMEIIILDVD